MTSATKPPPASTVASPCISVCVLDPATGWCKGCLRTIDEIAVWGGLDDDAKRGVLARLALRRATTGEGHDGER